MPMHTGLVLGSVGRRLEKLMEDDATCKRGKPFAPGNRSGKGRPDGSRNHWALELLEGEPCSPRLGITMLSWPAVRRFEYFGALLRAIVKDFLSILLKFSRGVADM
jgi:hypothetical protein